MARLKTFLIYALIIIVFYFYSNLMIQIGIKATYRTIEKGEILTSQPKIEVQDAKATYINGYIEGKITNNTQNTINNKYIKIDLYSENDIYLGTKYIKIQNLEVNKEEQFRMAFKYADVKSFKIRLVDEAEDAKEEQFISEEMTTTILFTTIFLLCIAG